MKCTQKSLRVLVVDDNQAFRHRLGQAVVADPRLHLLAAVGTAGEAITIITRDEPDVVLVDLGLPDQHGSTVIRYVSQHLPQSDCLVVTMFGDDANVIAAIEAGASGYLLKEASDADICRCIHDVSAGGSPISLSVARKVLAKLRDAVTQESLAPTAAAQASAISPLSPREREVLQLASKGLSVEETANALGIADGTVETHVKRIYRKLAVHSRAEAIYEATQQGFL
jgi:DNA-binding NarL/FixJ family response regulator